MIAIGDFFFILCHFLGSVYTGDEISFYPDPRFRQQNAITKIHTIQSLRVKLFSLRKNTLYLLTICIDGTDSQEILLFLASSYGKTLTLLLRILMIRRSYCKLKNNYCLQFLFTCDTLLNIKKAEMRLQQ